MTRTLLLSAALVAGAVSSAFAVPASAEEGLRVEARMQDRHVVEGLPKNARMRAANARRVSLAPPSAEKSAIAPATKGVRVQVGFTRSVAALETEAATQASLAWESLADGASVAAIEVASPGALSVRAGLRIAHLPDGAKLRFMGPGDEMLFDTTGERVNAALATNAAAGAKGEDARTYWSPVVEGDTVRIEIEVPQGTAPHAVRIAIPRVSHLVASAGTAFATPTTIGSSASCQVDSMCTSGWTNQMNAVAQMIFSDSAGSYLCTGTLVADSDAATSTPYFLTANHCISSQPVASSLVTYWFYRSTACDTRTPGTYRQLAGGAVLLHATTSTDSAFMRLNNTPPQGTYFAGWYSGTAKSLGTGVTGLHQPRGDLLKASRGTISGYLTCTAPSNNQFSCDGSTAGSSTFYDVRWSSGITEPGSSGSGLFLADGTLVGQLYGGSSACSGTGSDVYGRFDVVYNGALKNWLGLKHTLAVAKAGSGSGTVTSAPAGISCGATCSAGFASGTAVTLTASAAAGSSFAGWSGACSGTGSCSVAMTAAASVTANFVASATPTLTVSNGGGGTVTSNPAGISCGSTCIAAFASGSVVTLNAVPAAGRIFTGWTGACAGTGSCSISMNQARSVGAQFVTPPDLAIAQVVGQPRVAGKDVAVALTASNLGPAQSEAVAVTYTIPSGTSFVWASPTCTQAASTVTCALGAMGVGSTAALTVVVRPNAAGSFTSLAAIAGQGADPTPTNNSTSSSFTAVAGASANLALRYRLYSPVTLEHHFTTDQNEYSVLGSFTGTWVQEGTAGRVLDNPGSYNGVAAVPYYRLYNTTSRHHHWTADANEYYTLAGAAGWTAEGVDGYVLPQQAPGTIALYRLSLGALGLHHWTTDAHEYETLSKGGWTGEGAAGYVVP